MRHVFERQNVPFVDGPQRKLNRVLSERAECNPCDASFDDAEDWELLEPDDDELHSSPQLDPLIEDDDEPEEDIWPHPAREFGEEWDRLTPRRTAPGLDCLVQCGRREVRR